MDVAEYLFKRLHEVGIRSVHGVPGDYNLVALDYLPQAGLKWVGNCNELNASYSADGYARVKGIGAMITTFGVGELSALNGIAGSYAEYVPVVHIVGTPSTLSQADGMLLHHTLGNGDFKVFESMSANISCAVSSLRDPLNAAELIDHAIRQCYIQSRPDMVTKKVEGQRLEKPIDLSYPPNDKDQEDYAVSVVLKHLREAKRAVILVDACAIRHRALDETRELVTKSGLPTFVAPMGKGAVDETLPNYGGVYAGDGSHPAIREAVESSDLVLSSCQLNSIDFHSFHIQVKFSVYQNCRMNGVLRKVTQQLGKINVTPIPPVYRSLPEGKPGDQTITHEWLWPRLSNFMRDNDIIISETGTSSYGIWEVLFKKGAIGISQVLWGSIGFAFGCTQGAALAGREEGNRRTILFTGEGSMQLTAQELSTMIRLKLTPVLFVICNEGYTIERFIHGMDAAYNDVGDWKYCDLPTAFGAPPASFKAYQLKTKDDVTKALDDKTFGEPDVLKVVEVHMPKDDAPMALQMTAEASARNNAKQ
ncbi:MAG: hypothetical protein Q9162_006419 [Coniocarpon cinnabarinum]